MERRSTEYAEGVEQAARTATVASVITALQQLAVALDAAAVVPPEVTATVRAAEAAVTEYVGFQVLARVTGSTGLSRTNVRPGLSVAELEARIARVTGRRVGIQDAYAQTSVEMDTLNSALRAAKAREDNLNAVRSFRTGALVRFTGTAEGGKQWGLSYGDKGWVVKRGRKYVQVDFFDRGIYRVIPYMLEPVKVRTLKAVGA